MLLWVRAGFLNTGNLCWLELYRELSSFPFELFFAASSDIKTFRSLGVNSPIWFTERVGNFEVSLTKLFIFSYTNCLGFNTPLILR